MMKYSTSPIVVPDEETLDDLAKIKPGQRLLIGYECHPVFQPLVSSELSERAHALITTLEAAGRIMRFMVRQDQYRFAYIALGVTPQAIQRVEAIAASVQLPPSLREITQRYAQTRKA